ncbi:YheC/D-like protein [Anoxybacillus vitaminiphilus]|uniref:YheC/D-like protein n=1 Tax=Paranoxybacillus vitaminiphilus TaxID=581036 RepID=A0A327YEK8_9BACL|nr:YheC/YheD family protein [Anoxybacillus vitaminiphilus]RAK19460.1 YheC/D-like protein [Anoxybacillus vitaminiphilus]
MIYTLKLSEKGQKTVWLPSNIPITGQTQAMFGSYSEPCLLISRLDDKNEITITKDLAKKLKIPFSSPICVFLDEQSVHLGPLIGIFTAGFRKSNIRPLGKRTFFFAKLLTKEKEVGGFAFVFGAHHINWETGTINGYFYTENGWKQFEVPFPNVIYNRLPNRRTENEAAFQQIKHKLKNEYLIPWFNESFFNKWEIYRLLQKHPSALPYLPETHAHPTEEIVQMLLEKYGRVYVKPANGSHGLSVYQIIQAKDQKTYYCRYRDEYEQNRLKKFTSLSSLWNKTFAQKEMERYIVQQGIPLIRYKGRQVDFRIHTNKNKNGKWQVSAIAAKTAGKGSVTTHINNGGIVKTLDEIFEHEQERCFMTEKLKEAALTLSQCLEEQMGTAIGEIGFDIGIDKKRNVWLFEANSKPGRSIFTHPKLKKYEELTTTLSLEYGLYLSEQIITKPEAIIT